MPAACEICNTYFDLIIDICGHVGRFRINLKSKTIYAGYSFKSVPRVSDNSKCLLNKHILFLPGSRVKAGTSSEGWVVKLLLYGFMSGHQVHDLPLVLSNTDAG